jgi:sec-independent protein translocase protein TatB
MFGLNWGEVIVIGIVALIAIGPKELPTVLRTLGMWMGKVRRMANEFQNQFQEALREAEIADLKKHADELSSSVGELAHMDPMADVQKDVERAFEEPPAADVATPAAPATAGEAAATAPAAPPQPLPDIAVPLPEPPAAVSHEDFARAAPPAPASKAGGGA